MTGSNKSRPKWSDRFHTPTPEDLRAGVSRQFVPAVELACKLLCAPGGVREHAQWRGVWNWTIVYDHGSDDGPAIAYIVPDPERPRLCVPCTDELIAELPLKRLSKPIRETLGTAPLVDAVRWPVWDIQSKAQVEEVLAILSTRPVRS